jgi:peptidoglycan/xylan/chitin deacetylase (PgdA/CDA1 family)
MVRTMPNKKRMAAATCWRATRRRLGASLLAAACVLAANASDAAAAERAMAVTFDDLPAPGVAVVSNTAAGLRENTAKLLAAVRAHAVPAVGFVCEGKLVVEGEGLTERAARVGVLEMWLEAGLELGNHTYSHPSLNQTPLEEYQADVVRGEATLLALLGPRGQTLRYFRHPFLQVGKELEKRRAFEAFLTRRGYTIAPVTIDNDDYVYAALYASALRHGDAPAAQRIGSDYLRYMESVFAFVEDVSRRLTGREIRQILLLHANAINADYFDRLAARIEARGYRFISLEQALQDDAYRLPDTYVGAWGISWLHHWEMTAGQKRSTSPDPPDWVMQAYQALR